VRRHAGGAGARSALRLAWRARSGAPAIAGRAAGDTVAGRAAGDTVAGRVPVDSAYARAVATIRRERQPVRVPARPTTSAATPARERPIIARPRPDISRPVPAAPAVPDAVAADVATELGIEQAAQRAAKVLHAGLRRTGSRSAVARALRHKGAWVVTVQLSVQDAEKRASAL